MDIYEQFNVILTSSQLRDLKPMINVYTKVRDLCGLNQNDNIIFFDDMDVNLASGKRMGWTTVHITDKIYKYKDTINLKTCDLIEYIDYSWNNIDDAVKYFIALQN